MSFARSCIPCRTAKAKCDLVRPTCGRCRQRGLACGGFPDDEAFIFRDERGAARRNSERARATDRSPVSTVPLGIISLQQTSPGSSSVVADVDLQLQLPWLHHQALAEIPSPLKRDIEARAVERFFINWTLHPGNDGIFPGHMHDLPILYLNSPPESVLWLAVRAVALADMRHELTADVTFHAKARQHYGAALSRMREIAEDGQELADDRVLAAVLLIDDFESMYLGRTEPLGPHSNAVRHMLIRRGNTQFFDRSRFALWCVAHQRLLTRQVALREKPDAEQMAWMGKLNTTSPDMRICADVIQMNVVSAAARELLGGTQDDDATPLDKVERVRHLAYEIQDLLDSIDTWTTSVATVWKPEAIDPQCIAPPQYELDNASNVPIPYFPCPRFLSYNDIWLAHMWNFHAASQIFLRESLIEIINRITALQGQAEPEPDDVARMASERAAVDRLAASIIRSYPPLLGFTHRQEGREPGYPPQGKMAGRLFSIFSMWVVRRAQFTSPQHKQTAREVTQWINSRHGLG
ncbi:hypothetical protein BJ170DRAFT_625787 [Xylariales sp. AK1849]|nr:hypothetical protein BJ170DRAFT_625787 [Xylariales sp. AK1849]